MREQQGVTGGVPRVTLSKPLSTLAHTPSFRASLGHEAWPEGPGLGLGFGLGLGLGLGFGRLPGLEPGHELHALVTIAKKRRLSEKKRASEAEVLEAISQP